MVVAPSASYSFTVRLEIRNRPGMLGRVTSVIGKSGGDIGAVDLVEMTGQPVTRDITVIVNDDMKIAAAHAIASCVATAELSPEYIIPSVFNRTVAPAVAREVARAAHKTGVARRWPLSDSPAWS